VWKAHGNAEASISNSISKPQSVWLFQVDIEFDIDASKAVLEQPSSRHMLGETPGRRNIVLLQSSELNQPQEQRQSNRPGKVRQPLGSSSGVGFRS